MIYTYSQLVELARKNGFGPTAASVIAAIAMAESGGNTNSVNTAGNSPQGSRDRGVLQFNDYWHNEVSDSCAFDAQCSMQQAYRVSNGGTNFNQWVTYTNGAYKQYLQNPATIPLQSGTSQTGGNSTTVPTDAASTSFEACMASAITAGLSPMAAYQMCKPLPTTIENTTSQLDALKSIAGSLSKMGTLATALTSDKTKGIIGSALWSTAKGAVGIWLMLAAAMLFFLPDLLAAGASAAGMPEAAGPLQGAARGTFANRARKLIVAGGAVQEQRTLRGTRKAAQKAQKQADERENRKRRDEVLKSAHANIPNPGKSERLPEDMTALKARRAMERSKQVNTGLPTTFSNDKDESWEEMLRRSQSLQQTGGFGLTEHAHKVVDEHLRQQGKPPDSPPKQIE